MIELLTLFHFQPRLAKANQLRPCQFPFSLLASSCDSAPSCPRFASDKLSGVSHPPPPWTVTQGDIMIRYPIHMMRHVGTKLSSRYRKKGKKKEKKRGRKGREGSECGPRASRWGYCCFAFSFGWVCRVQLRTICRYLKLTSTEGCNTGNQWYTYTGTLL